MTYSSTVGLFAMLVPKVISGVATFGSMVQIIKRKC
jgi:hypothetical protein